MDEPIASTSRDVPSESRLGMDSRKRKSALERELETNMTEKMTSPLTPGENVIASRYGRARKLKSSDDFLPSEKLVITPRKATVQRKPSPPRSPTVFKMNASKSPVKVPTTQIVASSSRSAVTTIKDLLNQTESLSRFGTDVKSPPKQGKVYVRRDLIQNSNEKTGSIIKNMFSPVKSPSKSVHNSSHLTTILERSSAIDGSKSGSPHRSGNKLFSPRDAQLQKKSLSPRQASLIEHPSVIKMLSFTEEASPKKATKTKTTVNEPETWSAPAVPVDLAYEALERSCAYQANDVAWARVGGYPFWPCLVTRDPYTGHIVKEKVSGGRQPHTVRAVHVTYLADHGRRGWLRESMLRPFRGLQELTDARDAFTPEQKKKDPKLYAAYLISDKRRKVWDSAVQEAQTLLERPSHTRIDVLYEIVYDHNKNDKEDLPQAPRKGNVKKDSIENRNISLSESLLDTLFSEDVDKVTHKVKSRKSLDVSDVVTACLDDMATKTGNIKIQKQSHMDRWLQKAKSKTPEKAVENANIVSAEKIRSRKNKRDIPSDDSDVSRTIQRLKKRPRNSANYSLRTDSSSGVDSEESKRNSLDERLNENREKSRKIIKGNLSEKIKPAGTSINGYALEQSIQNKTSTMYVTESTTIDKSDETNSCSDAQTLTTIKTLNETETIPNIENDSDQCVTKENCNEINHLTVEFRTPELVSHSNIEVTSSAMDLNVESEDMASLVKTNCSKALKKNDKLDKNNSEHDISNDDDLNITLAIDESSNDTETANNCDEIIQNGSSQIRLKIETESNSVLCTEKVIDDKLSTNHNVQTVVNQNMVNTDNAENNSKEIDPECIPITEQKSSLLRNNNSLSSKKCMVFVKRMDLKPIIKKQSLDIAELHCSNEQLKGSPMKPEHRCEMPNKPSEFLNGPENSIPKRALRKRKTQNDILNSVNTVQIGIECNSAIKVYENITKCVSEAAIITKNADSEPVKNPEVELNLITQCSGNLGSDPQNIILSESFQIEYLTESENSDQNIAKKYEDSEKNVDAAQNANITSVNCADVAEGNRTEDHTKTCYDNPDFLLYVETKQDMIMDANPHLAQEELMSHLYSLWMYEESKIPKEMKSMNKTMETDWAVKPQSIEPTDTFKGDLETIHVIKNTENSETVHQVTEKTNSSHTFLEKENNQLLHALYSSNNGGVVTEMESATEYNRPSYSMNLESKQNEIISDNGDLNNDALRHEESKKINQLKVVPNALKENSQVNIMETVNLQRDIEVQKTKEILEKVCAEEKSTVVVNNIFELENEPKVAEVCPEQISQSDTNILIQANKIDSLNKPAMNTENESNAIKEKYSLDVSVEIESCSINSDEEAKEFDIQCPPKHKRNLEDKTLSLENFQSESSSSESGSEVENVIEGNLKNNNKYDDPNFRKYIESKQDMLMDEHPHLTEEEVISYLYDMWSFSENNKTDEIKNNDVDEINLVKGLGSKKVLQRKKTYKKRVRTPKEFDSVNEVFIPKDKPTRKKAVRTYYDTESDSESLEQPKESPNQDELNKLQPYAKEVVKIEDESVDIDHKLGVEHTEVKDDRLMAELLKPKPNLFKGLIRERLCEICDCSGNLIKCRGQCGGMFHIECVIKQAEPKPEGTRKKKRKPGRPRKMNSDSDHSRDSSKINGVDSDGNSDEKSQENMSLDELSEIKSHTIDNAEHFESQLETKMREILESAQDNENSLCSSGDELDWKDTVAGQCEIVDVKLRLKSEKKPEDFLINFKCNDCQKYDQPLCFVCKSVESPKLKMEARQNCSIIHCTKVYHLECLNSWPQTQFSGSSDEHITCPRHVCHTCVCDDPRGCKTRFSGDKLARCVRCPAVYHSFTKCLPAGTKILNGSHIICPRHYEQRPGKVPYHVNTSWCFICALGGTLICCEYCPMSFHADCLNIQPPEDGYMCEDCETGRLPLYGEMVWAKLGNYRWWPGLILHPSLVPDNVRQLRHATGEFVVRFFGGNDHFWLYRGRVFPYQEGDTGKVSTQKSKIDTEFMMAVEQAQRTYKMLKEAKENEEEGRDIASSLLPPHYVRLRVNRPHGALAAPARRDRPHDEEGAATPCDCRPDDDEPCGVYTQCLNRVLLTECGPACRAGERCRNRCFELRLYPRLAPRRTPHRGWGLHTLEDIKKGQFVIEYVGELIDGEEFRRRMRRMHEVRDENYYFLTLDKDRMIDAGPKGNAARFMNHSCEPNTETQKWTVLGDVRVGLFALQDIPAGSEVTFNYNLECAGVDKKRCMCGAARCAGYIGAKPKQEEPKPKQAKRKYNKKPRAEPPPPAGCSAAPARKPRRSNTSLNASFKSKEMLEIEQDLLIIRNATRDVPSDTESDGSAGRAGRGQGSEPKLNGMVNHETKQNEAEVNGEPTVNGDVQVNGDCDVSDDPKMNEEPKVNGDGKDTKGRKSEKVLRVALERRELKESEKSLQGETANPLKRKRVSFSSEEVVIRYDSPQSKRGRTDSPKGYEAAFFQFLKRDVPPGSGQKGRKNQ